MYAFRDARRKIRRAHELCDELALEERELSRLHEAELVAVEMSDHWQIRIGAVFEVGEHWSLRISEVMFHLRSAFDHIAYELAVQHTGDPLPAKMAQDSQFPIFTEPVKYEQKVGRWLAGVDPALLPLFRRLQPFPEHLTAAPRTPLDEVPQYLLLLNEMHRREKHRCTPILTRAALSASWIHDQPQPVLEGGPEGPDRGLLPGDIVARCAKANGFVPLTEAQPRFTFKAGTFVEGIFRNLPGSLRSTAMMTDRACMALTGYSGNGTLSRDVLLGRTP